jgi:hypothetical protein
MHSIYVCYAFGSASWAVILTKYAVRTEFGPTGSKHGHAVPTELGPYVRRASRAFFGWSLASLAPIKLRYP